MKWSTLELRASPLAAELYAVIDVLVAVGFDLEQRDAQNTDAARGDARLTREREGLGTALCMLADLAARQATHPPQATSAAQPINRQAGKRHETKALAQAADGTRLLHAQDPR
jgi:hypothetical protein